MIRWLLAFVCFFAPLPIAQAVGRPPAVPTHMPTPAGLAGDVRFWEAVFGKYAPDQCIFHDRDDLTMIYAVKRIPGANLRQQARAVKHYLGILQGAIEHLAAGGEPGSRLERRIYQITPDAERTPAFWRDAASNVRCQRGVDLRPSLARSKAHLRMVKRVLIAEGLPADLAYLPHLESGYNVLARSRAGARGLWQLMPATARLAGLRVGHGSDVRTDPYRATLAAAGMLKDFYARTGSWPLAITAYNYGINGTVRAIKQWGADYMSVRENHKSAIFGFAAKNYYPSFLAVRNVSSRVESGELAMGGTRVGRGM